MQKDDFHCQRDVLMPASFCSKNHLFCCTKRNVGFINAYRCRLPMSLASDHPPTSPSDVQPTSPGSEIDPRHRYHTHYPPITSTHRYRSSISNDRFPFIDIHSSITIIPLIDIHLSRSNHRHPSIVDIQSSISAHRYPVIDLHARADSRHACA